MSYTDRYKDKIEAASKIIKREHSPTIKREVARVEPREEDFCMGLTGDQPWQFECAVRENLKEIRQRCLDEILGGKK